jgi:hypothetical protein
VLLRQWPETKRVQHMLSKSLCASCVFGEYFDEGNHPPDRGHGSLGSEAHICPVDVTIMCRTRGSRPCKPFEYDVLAICVSMHASSKVIAAVLILVALAVQSPKFSAAPSSHSIQAPSQLQDFVRSSKVPKVPAFLSHLPSPGTRHSSCNRYVTMGNFQMTDASKAQNRLKPGAGLSWQLASSHYRLEAQSLAPSENDPALAAIAHFCH